ncbi:PrsW family intramembrane metalloprotease [Halobacteriovorax sp. YZS-1-1]|uniref:PrsW family intramembrane metalloprotease n=1 Tax=unclassified Halobacteriovorax TaxID=2639665 RepID=UPI00399B36AD
MIYILISISFLLGAYSIFLIRKYDVYEPQPVHTLIISIIVGGALSIFFTLLLRELISPWLDPMTKVGRIIFAGVTEEPAKLVTFLLIIKLFKKYVTEGIDFFVYMFCVSLGFSLIENIEYATMFKKELILSRFIFTTPMHIMSSSFMAFSTMCFYYNKGNVLNVVISILFAIIFHGVHNSLALTGKGLFVLLNLSLFYVWTLREFLIFALLNFSRRVSLFDTIIKAPYIDKDHEVDCIHCDNREPKVKIATLNVKINICHECGMYLCSIDDLLKILDFFTLFVTDQSLRKLYNLIFSRSAYSHRYGSIPDNRITNPYITESGIDDLYEVGEGGFYCSRSKRAYFDLKKLDHYLKKITIQSSVKRRSGFVASMLSSFDIKKCNVIKLNPNESSLIELIQGDLASLGLESDIGNYAFGRYVVLLKRDGIIEYINLKRFFSGHTDQEISEVIKKLKYRNICK